MQVSQSQNRAVRRSSFKGRQLIISCLHTADSNVAVFENAARELGLSSANLRHTVRADLLRAAEEAGGLTEDITQQTAAVLSALAAKADAVLLTCSTLGPSVVRAGVATAVPILRVDAALAEKAAATGGKLVALCAVETTVAPTTAFFAAAAHRSGAALEVRLVEGAWACSRREAVTVTLPESPRRQKRPMRMEPPSLRWPRRPWLAPPIMSATDRGRCRVRQPGSSRP